MVVNPDRPPPGYQPVIAPLPSRRNKPPKDWAEVELVGDAARITLSGWRAVFGLRRALDVPFARIESADWEPSVYGVVPTTLRPRVKPRSHLWRIGVYRGRLGWSFWSCGMGRNALLIRTENFRFRFVVVERHDISDVLAGLNEALERFRHAAGTVGDAGSSASGGGEPAE